MDNIYQYQETRDKIAADITYTKCLTIYMPMYTKSCGMCVLNTQCSLPISHWPPMVYDLVIQIFTILHMPGQASCRYMCKIRS